MEFEVKYRPCKVCGQDLAYGHKREQYVACLKRISANAEYARMNLEKEDFDEVLVNVHTAIAILEGPDESEAPSKCEGCT